jgi:hypothetical protein
VVPIALGVAAVTVRFWGLDQGLPHPMARPDEREALERMIGFPAGDLNPHWVIYPNLYLWVLWGWMEAALAVERLFVPVPSFVVLLHDDPAHLMFLGRVLAALTGSATVVLTWHLGRRAAGQAVGCVAATLVAANVLHVRDSHTMKSEVFVTLAMLVALGALARWAEARGPAAAARAGAAVGLAGAFKYPGLLIGVLGWIADIARPGAQGWRRLVPSRDLTVLGLTAMLVFLAGSPFVVLDPNSVGQADLLRQMIFASRPGAQGEPSSLVAGIANFMQHRAFGYHLTVSLRRGFGLAAAIATLPALVVAVRSRTWLLRLSAAFVALWWCMAGASAVHLSRYLTPVVPALSLCLASLVVAVARRTPRPLAPAAVCIVLTAALAAEPAAASVAWVRLAARTDTRILATQWMTEHLPPGAHVARLGSVIFPIADPVLPSQVVPIDLPPGSVNLANHDVTHVVTHEHVIPFSVVPAGQWAAIRPHVRLLAEFSPWRTLPGGGFEREDAFYIPLWGFDHLVRPGPLVRVWAVEPAASSARR